MITDQFKDILETSRERLKKFQNWPGYFHLRYLEFLSVYESLPRKKFDRVLELGSGIGYHSAFLSKISKEVIATDLASERGHSHTPGLDLTKEFLKELKIDNVTLKDADAEDLPFADNSFDLVFSTYVFQYIPDKEKAIREINRVLKPGGLHVAILPTSMDRFWTFFSFYTYIAKRSFYHLLIRPFKRPESSNVEENTVEARSTGKTFGSLKSFPFPPSDTGLDHYLVEMKKRFPLEWRKIFLSSGNSKLVLHRGLTLTPLPLLSNIANAGVKIFSFTRKAELFLGRFFPFKFLTISNVIATEKLS